MKIFNTLSLLLILVFIVTLTVSSAEDNKMVTVKLTDTVYSGDSIDQLYQKITARFPNGTPLVMRCLLNPSDFRGGRNQNDLHLQNRCDHVIDALEDRGLYPVFPTTSERLPSEKDFLMVILPVSKPY